MDQTQANAISLIKTFFGNTVGLQYEQFYSTQTTETVKLSIKELLIEYLGEEQATKKLKEQNLL